MFVAGIRLPAMGDAGLSSSLAAETLLCQNETTEYLFSFIHFLGQNYLPKYTQIMDLSSTSIPNSRKIWVFYYKIKRKIEIG